MSSDITLDAVISLVTVSKLTKMNVDANCYCPGKGSGWSGNSNSNNNRGLVVTPPPAVSARAVTSTPSKPAQVAPKVVESLPTRVAEPAPVVQAAPAVVAEPEPVVHALPVADPVPAVEEKPVEVPDSVAALDTADNTAADSTTASISNNTVDSLLEYTDSIKVTGTFTSAWKTDNVPGEYELYKEDSMGRPIYKRKELTSDGGVVYLYHIHHSKKWRVGPVCEGQDAYNCWLYITSKVDQPLLISRDQQRTRRNWKEYDTATNKWMEVKNMKISKL